MTFQIKKCADRSHRGKKWVVVPKGTPGCVVLAGRATAPHFHTRKQARDFLRPWLTVAQKFNAA